MEKGIKILCRNTETGESHLRRRPLGPWELLVLHRLCDAEAEKLASAWNEPRARVSEQSQGQGGLLVIGLLVLSLPWSCCSSLHLAVTLARLGRGATGLLLAGLHRSRVGIQVLLALEEEGQDRRAAHTAGSKPRSSLKALSPEQAV